MNKSLLVQEEDIIKYGFNVYTNPLGTSEFKRVIMLRTFAIAGLCFIILGITVLSTMDKTPTKVFGGIVLTVGICSGITTVYFYRMIPIIDSSFPVFLTSIPPNSTNLVSTYNKFVNQGQFYTVHINYPINNV